MRLTRGKKIALAVATAWPPLYMTIYVGVFMLMFLSVATMTHGAAAPNGVSMPFLVILLLQYPTMVWGIALLSIYVAHALQNQKLDQDNRMLWAVLIVVGNFVTMPIYFCRYVLPLQDDAV